MKRLLGYLRIYWREHYHGPLYWATAALVLVLTAFNYAFDFEDSIIDADYGKHRRVLWFFLAHALPYYATCALVSWATGRRDFWRQRDFWLVSSVGLLVLAFDRGNFLARPWARALAEPQTYRFVFKMVNRWLPLLTLVLPLALFYVVYLQRYLPHFYGIRTQEVHLTPYLALLCLLVPLIAVASFQPDFLREYPNYQRAGGAAFAAFYQIDERWVVLFYELSYGFGFFVVELFFRGFLILALAHFLGPAVVLPAAVTYCVLHYGKPLGEAVSSFFGGYILGVIALRTGNIYGGILIHVGLAWLMELFAFWQR